MDLPIKTSWWFIMIPLFLFASNSANGCTCDLPPLDKSAKQQVIEARHKAKAVLMGRVLNVDSPDELFYRKVTVEVYSAWKGSRTEKITIFTGRGGNCGYTFEVGATYLIYAYQYNGSSLGTNICQRTKKVDDASVDLRYLGKPEFKARVHNSRLSA